jgi:hypothetical protein
MVPVPVADSVIVPFPHLDALIAAGAAKPLVITLFKVVLDDTDTKILLA